MEIDNNNFEKIFIKGFITGQIVLGFLIFFLLKVFLLRGASETRSDLLQAPKLWSFAKQKVLLSDLT
jgi:hypothetical protein